jgi:transposase
MDVSLTTLGIVHIHPKRNQPGRARKAQRNRMTGWAFCQLRTFISYKAARAGVPMIVVDPRNTSRTCSVCGHCQKANRKNRSDFVCKACGHKASADENAAQNIRNIGLLSCSLTAPPGTNAGVIDAGPGGSAETACKPRRFSGRGS